jgi:hypothetical protein
MVLSGAASAAFAQDCVVPPPGAIYWLAGERNFDDLAGFHNGHSGATDVSFVPGKVGEAMRFDGIDDYVYPNVTSAEERAHRSRFSFELWARPTRSMAACAESNSGTCGIGLPWAIFPENGTNSAPPGEGDLAAGIGIAIGTNGVCVGQHAGFLASCLARVDTSINDWIHVAVVVENKTPRIYLNGTLVRTGVASNKQFVFASWSVIGNGATLGLFAGDLDEVTVYDRALGDAEIAALFAAGTSGKCKQACAIERTDDAWQSALVTAHTPLRSSGPNGMFGSTVGSPEPTTTLFAEGLADGTVHAIEWQTATPVTLGSFGVYAFHSENDDTIRSFRHLRLQAREIGGTFATFYESPIVLPYGQGDNSRELFRCPRLRPLHAQQFRAEFVQEGAAGQFSGTRLAELDGLIHDPIFRDAFESAGPQIPLE